MSFKKSLLKNILISGSYNYASQIISFLSTVVTSRYLGPEAYGFVGIINIFTGFLLIFSDSGITLAVIRSGLGFSYQKSVDNIALIVGCILCFLTVLLSYPIAFFFSNPALVYPMIFMSLNFVFKSMTLVRTAVLAKNMRFNESGQITLYAMLITVCLTMFMAYLGAGFWSLIVPQIVSSLITLVMLENKIRLGYKVYPIAYLKVAFKQTKKTIGNLMGFNMVNYWARNSDNLIVGKFYGESSLGIYSRAYNLLTVPLSLITGLIGSVLYPSLNKIKDKPDEIRSEYAFTLKMITYISFPITFILVVFPKNLVLLLWGENWLAVSTILPYFGLLIFSQSLLSTVGNILVLVKKEDVLRKSGWLGAVIMISAICIGARYSINAIAQFYSLSFILIILPFNIFYIYIRTLKFGVRQMLLFWTPIVIFSFVIWLGCVYHAEYLKLGALSLLLVALVLNSAIDIKKLLRSTSFATALNS